MGVGGTCGPFLFKAVREIGQTARLSSRSLGDFTKRGGSKYGRCDSTWFVRPADARAGFSSVLLAGSPLAVRSPHQRPTGYQPDPLENLMRARGTQAPGIDDVSPDWKLA